MQSIETDRLLLRPWQAADFNVFAAFYADDAGAKFVGGNKGRTDAWRQFAIYVGH